MAGLTEDKARALRNFSACDVSDALLKLQDVPSGTTATAGFLADLAGNAVDIVVAPISTVQFIPKGESLPPIAQENPDLHGFPTATHWVDLTQPGTVVLVDQPDGQKCAVLGGIMASRMSAIGAKGVIVNGRVRDLNELRNSGLSIWARGQSTVGAGAEAKPGARNIPIRVGGVTVFPNDIAFCDPVEGVVVIPNGLLDSVLELMPRLTEADDRVRGDIENGSTVFDAFKKHRL
ncbi:hypothetical protein LOY94_001458 [Ophidiomyces ophidiicola]|nr:hypothetical protein LOZ62_006577 [Ophidiomyces ophidiicola]KAI1993400.1 hypothetical protein LOZ54_001320 [Ophidiomyces ophidiicola]KAI1997001.1 hypothetical protein LOZ51_003164 [Ophidiomyces ophidiicola]KAI2041895.1 hypothetical protein LOZ47_000090 [Ophidiomyces ophidiicola]KAI2086484.1 hypothetical protein LOZ36_003291 [Ophidiomyces ophidiicola]